jgi:hypothetical protein
MKAEAELDSDAAITIKPSVYWITLIGLTLLIGPLTILGHELGAHAATCMAIGGRVTSISAFNIDCVNASGATPLIVSTARTMAEEAEFKVVRWFELCDFPFERSDPQMRRFVEELRH